MTDVYSRDDAERILREIVTPSTWATMSRKVARFELEKRLGLAEDSLKAKREEINEILDKIVEELQGQAGEESSDSSENAGADSDSEGEPAQKKQKNSANDPPKNLKKLQARMMTKSDFLKKAPQLKARIGEKLQFEMAPRTFSSGSCGWFFGKKVEMEVGGQSVWCQLGINCIVLGSKEWEESKKRKK